MRHASDYVHVSSFSQIFEVLEISSRISEIKIFCFPLKNVNTRRLRAEPAILKVSYSYSVFSTSSSDFFPILLM